LVKLEAWEDAETSDFKVATEDEEERDMELAAVEDRPLFLVTLPGLWRLWRGRSAAVACACAAAACACADILIELDD